MRIQTAAKTEAETIEQRGSDPLQFYASLYSGGTKYEGILRPFPLVDHERLLRKYIRYVEDGRVWFTDEERAEVRRLAETDG